MLKALINKQLTEIFRAYFYDAKKNQKRSSLSTVLLFCMYAFLMVGVLGGMFALLSVSLCEALVCTGMGWLYFTLMGLLAVLLGVFGSVFSTYSGLYLAKDNDFLLSLPIPVRYIMISRLLSVYLIGLLYSAVVILPAVIVYWISVPLSADTFIGSLLLVFLISVIVLILSCILGWVVARISLRLKNKSFITVLVSLLFLAAYYLFYFKAQSLIAELIANAAVYGEKIKGAAYPLYLFGRIGEGDWLAMLILTAATAALFVLTWRILSRSFIRIATSSGAASKTRYKETAARQKSVSAALLTKEFGRFTASPNYMLNCGLGTLLLPVCGVLLLLRGKSLVLLLDEMLGTRPGCTAVLLCAAVCMVASMNDMAAPSVSLEGKNLWLSQSLPVTPWQALHAKLSVQLLLTGIPALFCACCAAFLLPGQPLDALLLILTALLYTFFSACLNLFLGVRMPNLTWTNELVPIKQSINVMIGLLGGWAYAIALAGIYMAIGWRIGAPAYLAAASLVTAALSTALYLWLKKSGSRIFAEL